MIWGLLILIAFVAGSIPFGFLIARSRGVDLRRVGSGNIGATNVRRVLGPRAGRFCFALDMLKGFAPTLAAGAIHGLCGSHALSSADAWLWSAVAAASVLGHVFTPWLGFRGGKGVATGFGALLAIWPFLTVPVIAAVIVFAGVVVFTRYMSLGSIAAAAALPVLTWVWLGAGLPAFTKADAPGLLSRPHSLVIATAVLGLVVIVRHRTNIKRLVSGKEPRIDQRAADPPAKPE